MTAWAPVVFALGAATPAPAEPIALRVEFDAPAGCSSADAFYASVRARTDRVRRADDSEPALSLRVRLTVGAREVHGELNGVDEHGARQTRRVRGATCDEVVEALSLTAALALDPNARFQPIPVVPPTPDAPDAAPTWDARARAEEPRREPPDEPELDEPDEPDEPARADIDVEFELGAQVLATVVVASEIDLGGAIAGRLTRPGEGIFSPSFGLQLVHVRNDLLTDPGDSPGARVRFTSVVVTACPVRWPLTPNADLRPCAAAAAGVLAASGRNISHPESVSRSWWSLGGTLRAQTALGPELAIEIEAGLAVPLVRRRFVTTAPDTLVAETPVIAPSGALGVAYRF